MVTIKQCSFNEISSNQNFMNEVLEYSKSATNKQLKYKGFNPQFYIASENAGILKCIGVFDDDIIVGFAGLVLIDYPHYSVKVGTIETLYLNEAYRDNGLGSKLINKVRKVAKDNGCEGIYIGLPYGTPLADSILKRSKKHLTPVNILYYSEV